MVKARRHPPAPEVRSDRLGAARLRLALLVIAVLLACLGAARLGHAADAELAQRLAREALKFAREQVTPGPVPEGRRVAIEVGRLDPRLRLAPCDEIRPWLPRGTRLWGRGHVGLRCARGATAWNVYLPVNVRVYTQALASRADLPAGVVLRSEHLANAEIELSAERGVGTVFTDPQALVGRSLVRPVAAGEPLRSHQVQARRWFDIGDTVRITAQGGGFAVRGSGQALAPGIEGRSTRIRTASGRVVTAIPVGAHEVELSL